MSLDTNLKWNCFVIFPRETIIDSLDFNLMHIIKTILARCFRISKSKQVAFAWCYAMVKSSKNVTRCWYSRAQHSLWLPLPLRPSDYARRVSISAAAECHYYDDCYHCGAARCVPYSQPHTGSRWFNPLSPPTFHLADVTPTNSLLIVSN